MSNRPMTADLQRVVVIGPGEVGRRLMRALATAGVQANPVTRDIGWEAIAGSGAAPILVCVREEALPAVFDRLGGVDPDRLVLVQNGWIRPLLGGWESASRALIWFTSKGEFFRELRPSLFGGTLAGPLVAALHRGGLDVAAVGDPEFRAAEAEKMGFNCVVGLPLAVHGVSLAEYLDQWTDEAHALFDESTTVCARALGVDPAPGWWHEFRRAVAPIGWVRAASAKALKFRNGAVLRLADDFGIGVPVTARLLAAAGYRPDEP
ncbi:MAG: hypothetical protein HY825_08210 [Acidobacteria bacterium]|nr:hypothetical protein [Acidobacteriota bacterium]